MAANIQKKWRKLVSIFDCSSSLQVYLLCGIIFCRNRMQICIYITYSVTVHIDKGHWKNLTLPMLPSSSPCSNWRGLLIFITMRQICSGVALLQLVAAFGYCNTDTQIYLYMKS